MAQNHKSTSTDFPRRRKSQRTSKKVSEKISSNGRKPSKKERTRNHTLKQPFNQNLDGASKKHNRFPYQPTSTMARYTFFPAPVGSTKSRSGVPMPTTCVYYYQAIYDVIPNTKRKSTRLKPLIHTKTSKISCVTNNGATCMGVVRTSSRTSRNGRKSGRRLDIGIDEEYYNEYDYNSSVWAY